MKIQTYFISQILVFLYYLIHSAHATWRTINTEFVGTTWADNLKNWQIIGVSTTPSSVCTQNASQQKIFGGQGKYGTGVILIKSYSSLPPHKNVLDLLYKKTFRYSKPQIIRIKFNGYFIANQNVATQNKVTFCGNYNTVSYACSSTAEQSSFTYLDATTSKCQLSSAFEKIYAFTLQIAHSNLNVNFGITNEFVLQSNDLSFALSDFQLEVDACHSSCATCSGDTFDTCLSCVINSTLTNNSCVCNPGFYPQYQQAPCLTSPCLICQPCYSTCGTCYGPSQNQCLSCKNTNNPSLFLQDFTCVSSTTCRAGTYPDSTAYQCLPCNQSCATCSGSTDLVCTSCASLRYLNPVNVGDNFGKCVSTCPLAKVLVVNKCVPCADVDCIQCQSDAANTCQLCTTDTSKNYLLFNNVCVSNRPNDSYYIDSTKRQIFGCISPCLTCSMYQGSVCQTCIPGYSLSLNTCVTQCPNGQYSLSQVCTNCDSNCLTCSTTAVRCQSCNANMFVDPLDFKCKVCQGSTYGDSVSGTCKPCDPSCLTCNGGTSTNCLTCDQTGAQPYYIVSTLQCVANCPAFPQDLYGDDLSSPKLCVQAQNCPAQHFADAASSPRKCSLCNSTCSQCFGPSSNQCSGCSGSLVLQGTVCISNCNPGYYPDTSRICQLCDASCKECNGGGPNSCTTCNPPLFLSSGGSGSFCKVTCDSPTFGEQSSLTCVTSCQPSFYPNVNSRLCTPCHPACNGCTGGQKNNCTQCAAPYFQFQGSCDYCPDQYYADAATQSCLKCPNSCSLCTGSNACQKCNPNYFLEGSNCVQECTPPKLGSQLTNTCESSCPISTYEATVNSIQRVCIKCSENCANCQDSQNCKDCFYPYFLNNSNQCVLQCPSNQFANRQLRICQNCDLSCKTCSGGLSSNCQSCQTGSYLYNGVCYTTCPSGTFANGDYCQSSCQVGFYADDNTRSCQKCNSGCLECYGKLFNNCITCQSGFALVNNQCVSTCPQGYYEELKLVSQVSTKSQNQNNNIRTCQLCSQECQICENTLFATLNQKNIICSQCSAEYYLNDKKCISNCPDGKIVNIPNRTCDICPDGYYKYNERTCQQCHFSCKQCSGQKYNECTQCWSNRGREFTQSDNTIIRVPYQSVCECDPGLYDLMENECISSKGNEYRTVQASESFAIIFPCLMFFDLYFFGNPINLLFSFEVVQQISLLQYTNIPLSLNIQQLLQFVQGFHLTDLSPKPFSLETNSPNSKVQQTTSRILATISNQDSYYKFSSNDKSNNFLNNSIYLIGVHLLLWAFIFFCKISQKNFQLRRLGYLNKIYFYLDLTVMLVVYFLTNYEMILNIALQLNDVDTSTSYNSFSFALCIIFIVYYFFFFIKMVLKVNIDKIFFKSKPPRKPYLINQFTRWCILFFTIRQRQSLQRNFYILLQIKKIIACIFLVTLYTIPSAQILSVLVVYVLFFFYLAIYKPVVNPYILALLLINEGFMIIFYIFCFIIYQQQTSYYISVHLNRTFLALLFLIFFVNLLIGFLIIFKKRAQIKQQLIGIYNSIRDTVMGKDRVKDYQQKSLKKRKNKKVRPEQMGDIVEEEDEYDEEEEEEDDSQQEQGEDDYNQDLQVENIDGESSAYQGNEKLMHRFKKKKQNGQNSSSQKLLLNRIESTEYYNIQDSSSSVQKRHGVVYLKEDLNYQLQIEFKNRLRRDQRLPKLQQNKSNQLNKNTNNNGSKPGLAQNIMNQNGRLQQNVAISSNQLNSSNMLDNSIIQNLDNSIDQSYQQILIDNTLNTNNQGNNSYSIVDIDQDDWQGKRRLVSEKLDQVDEMDEIIDEALDKDDEINMERLRQIQFVRSEQNQANRMQQRSHLSNPQDLRESYIQQQQNYNNYDEYVGTNEDFNNRPSSRLEAYEFNNQNQYNQMDQYNPYQEEGDDYNINQENNNKDLQFQELFGFDRIEYYDHSLDEEQRIQREVQDQNYREYMMQQQQIALQNMNIYQNNSKYQSGLKKNPTKAQAAGARDYNSPDLVDRYNEVDPEQLKKYLDYKKKFKLTQKFGFLSKSSLTQSPQKRLNSNQSRAEDPQRIELQLQQFYQQQ